MISISTATLIITNVERSWTRGENLIDAILALNMSNKRFAIASFIAPYQLMLSMFYSVNGRGPDALRASESVFELAQVGLEKG